MPFHIEHACTDSSGSTAVYVHGLKARSVPPSLPTLLTPHVFVRLRRRSPSEALDHDLNQAVCTLLWSYSCWAGGKDAEAHE